MDSDDLLAGLVSDLDVHRTSQTPISEASITSLQSLLNADPTALWAHLSSHNLPPSALLSALASAMDSSDPFPASRAYLSLLLAPSAPVHALFDPVAFFSLLASFRRATKSSNSSDPHPKKAKTLGKRRREESDSGTVLVELLRLLEDALSRVRLDRMPDGAKSLVDTLVLVLDSVVGQRQGVAELCFRILYEVVSKPEHGERADSCVMVMKALSPVVISPTKSGLQASARWFFICKLIPLGREGEVLKKAVVYLPNYLAMTVPEKSEARACAVQSVMEVLSAMELEDQIAFTEFAIRMLHGKVHVRLLAVDLILALIMSLPDPLGLVESESGGDDDADSSDPWGVRCLMTLVERCSDCTATVRSRALTSTGQAIEFLSKDSKNHARLRKLPVLGESDFNDLLRRRCGDEKATVRRASLHLIARSIMLMGGPIDDGVLKLMGRACSDPLVSVRKAALSALSEAFKRFSDSSVTVEWLHAVPPLISDNEMSIQEECENLFLELVLDRISGVGDVDLHGNVVLSLMKEICDSQVALHVKKICIKLGKKNKLKNSLASSLQNMIGASESLWLSNSMPNEKWTAPPGAWLLLSLLSPFMAKVISWEFLQHHWELLDKVKLEENSEATSNTELNPLSWASDRVYLLEVISNVSAKLPPELAAELGHNLLQRIEGFTVQLTEVDAHVKALKSLCKRKASSPEQGDSLVTKWVQQVLLKALNVIDTCVSKVKLINNFKTPRSEKNKETKELFKPSLMSQVTNAVVTVGSLVLICPASQVKEIVTLLHDIITSGFKEGKAKRGAPLTFSLKESCLSLYIHSWVTMGKICLADEKLAKCYIPLFIKELETSQSAALRNNILFVMVDLCIRYTSLVDCYIPEISNLLRDSCELLRRQAFILLSRLLQREYVKWRGVLFLRFLLTLVDDSEKIRHLADFLFGNILKVQAPLLAYNSFVEAIFVLNDCPAYSGQFENSKVGGKLFSLRGSDTNSRGQRMRIYIVLLKQMAPEQLLATSAKLCAEILAAASDGMLNLNDPTAQCVLQDALEILSCKEMRLQSSCGAGTTDMEDEGGEGAALASARGNAVTQVSKKNLIEHAIPVFIELKRLLESKNSPLTGCLMECLCILLKDYKNEIEDILVADKQLQKELIYDIKKYESAKARSTVADTISVVQKTNEFQSPTNHGSHGKVYAEVSKRLGKSKEIAYAVADIAARATARSVLMTTSGKAPSVSIHKMSVPKVNSSSTNGEGAATRSRRVDLEDSVRKLDFLFGS